MYVRLCLTNDRVARPRAGAPTDRFVAAGSRSDKKPRRAGSTNRKTSQSQLATLESPETIDRV